MLSFRVLYPFLYMMDNNQNLPGIIIFDLIHKTVFKNTHAYIVCFCSQIDKN